MILRLPSDWHKMHIKGWIQDIAENIKKQ